MLIKLINLKLFKVDYKSGGVKNNLGYSSFGEDEKQVQTNIIQRKI